MNFDTDSETRLVHSAAAIGANVHDKHPLPDLLRGTEKRLYGDRVLGRCSDIIKAAAPEARDFTNRRVRRPDSEYQAKRLRDLTRSRTRARFEQPFLMLKQLWGCAKVRYRVLAKNANRVPSELAMVNASTAEWRVPSLVRPQWARRGPRPTR